MGKLAVFVEINKGGWENGSGWVFVFEEGKDRIQKGYLDLNGNFEFDWTLDTSWYKPGVYNIAIIQYCRNLVNFKLSINNHSIDRYITTSGEQTIYAIAQGMDVVFDKN